MITQKEIAEMLGISRTTVARAINGDKYVRKETKDKILKLVEEKEYKKNFVGSSLASKKKNIYVFIVNSKNIYYTNQIKNGILDVKKEYKYYNIEIKEIITDINSPEEQLKKLRELLSSRKQIDGIIIIPLDRKKVFSILKPYLNKIKVVSIAIHLDENISHVGPNYLKHGKIAAGIVGNILNKGEHILVIDNGDDNISSKYYLDGFLVSIRKYNVVVDGPFKMCGIKDSIDFINFFEKKEKISSIFINRYAQDIFKKIPKEILGDKKIVTTGIGKRIKKLVQEGVIVATVADDIYKTGHDAAKLMFDILYKNINEIKNITSEAKILFSENI